MSKKNNRRQPRKVDRQPEPTTVHTPHRKAELTWLQRLCLVGSLLVALAALFVSLWSVRETRYHHRVTMRPLMSVYAQFEGSVDGEVGLCIENVGAGPAVILNCELLLDGVKYDSRGGDVTFAKFSGTPSIPWKLALPGANSGVQSGNGICILGMPTAHATPERIELFKQLMRRIRVNIKYGSMYGEVYHGTMAWEDVNYTDGMRNDTYRLITAEGV